MRRFFFTVDEAVKLVLTAMENIEELQGKVLSREMKAAQIEDLLTTWTKFKGGKYERIEGRPGERDDEFLIGETELPYTQVKYYDDVRHYIISFNEKVKEPLEEVFSSANASRLSEKEMMEIIDNPPKEEK
jgi:FlaA1/EpsC-like NDP-sugar epimerase